MKTIKLLSLASLFCLSTLSTLSMAGHHGESKPNLWQLSPEDSLISYGSIKKDVIGEVNHFKTIKGGISATGEAKISIDLNSVETYIGIRNERMIKHVFGENATTATLTTQLDIAAINKLAVGETSTLDVTGNLSFLDKNIEIEISFFIAKLSDSKLLATTDSMVMIKTEDLGVNAGIDKLMELAKLPGITRVAPVTLRFVFETGEKTAAAPTQAVDKKSLSANISAGKKVYRQCQACHNAKKEINTVGPHLVGITNRASGSVKGFNYSEALKADFVWSCDKLAAFIANPQKAVPGNKMPFGGLQKQQDINNLLAYLETL